MREKASKEEILKQNASTIERAVNQAMDTLLPKIDFKAEPVVFHSDPVPCQLMDKDGNFIDSSLALTFKSDYDEYYLVTDISLSNNLKPEKTAAVSGFDLMDFEDFDIGYMCQSFFIDEERESIDINANLTVKIPYRKLGIGRAILLSSEGIKRRLAKKLAETFKVNNIHTHFGDASDEEWTTKQVTTILVGYKPGADLTFDKDEPINE